MELGFEVYERPGCGHLISEPWCWKLRSLQLQAWVTITCVTLHSSEESHQAARLVWSKVLKVIEMPGRGPTCCCPRRSMLWLLL